MYRAYRQIFWGAIITLLNINIGKLNLLPNFAGYILIAIGLSKIISEHNDTIHSAKRASTLAWVLAAYSFVMIFISEALGGVINSVLTTAFMTADMLMCCFILSAGVHDANRETILKQQRNYLIITTISVASSCINLMIPGILWVTMLFGFVSKIYFIYLCHAIKRQFVSFCLPH